MNFIWGVVQSCIIIREFTTGRRKITLNQEVVNAGNEAMMVKQQGTFPALYYNNNNDFLIIQ